MTEEEIKNEEELQESVVNGSTDDTENEAPAEEPAEEKDPLEAAQEEIEQLKTQILYKTAEFDNYRKRTLNLFSTVARRLFLLCSLSLTIWSAPSRTVQKPTTLLYCVREWN